MKIPCFCQQASLHKTFKTLASVLVSILLWAPFAYADHGKLHIGATIWPPYTSQAIDSNKAGMLVVQALQKAGFTTELEILPWQQVLANRSNNPEYAIATLWRTENTPSGLLFSRPYLENRILVLSHKQATMQKLDLDFLAQKTIGLVTDYVYGDKVLANTPFKAVYSVDDKSNLDALLAGKVDAILIDELTARYLLKLLPGQQSEKLELSSQPLAVLPLYFAVNASHPHGKQIIAGFNQAIETMIHDGSYNRILGLPWIVTSHHKDISDVIVEALDQASQLKSEQPYLLFTDRPLFERSPKRRYNINNQVFEDWGEAKKALTDQPGSSDLEDQIETWEYQWLVPARKPKP